MTAAVRDVTAESFIDSSNTEVATVDKAGLVTTEKIGRVRNCKIGPCRLEEEMEWIARYRQVWDARFDALDRVIEQLKSREKSVVRKKRK